MDRTVRVGTPPVDKSAFGGVHLTEDELAEFLLGSGSEETAEFVRTHVRECDDCAYCAAGAGGFLILTRSRRAIVRNLPD